MDPQSFDAYLKWAARDKFPISFFLIPPDEAIIKDRGETFDVSMTVATDADEAPFSFWAHWSHQVWVVYPTRGYSIPAAQYTSPYVEEYPPRAPIVKRGEPVTYSWTLTVDPTGRTPILVPLSLVIQLTGPVIDAIRTDGTFYFAFWSLVVTPDIDAGRKKIEDAIRQFDQLKTGLAYMNLEKIKDAFKLPDMKFLDSKYPDISAAAEPFTISHELYNAGSPGKASLFLVGDGVDFSQPFDATDRRLSLPEELTMPWDDMSRHYDGSLFAELKPVVWVEELTLNGRTHKPLPFPNVVTDIKSWTTSIKAGFPDLKILSAEAPGEICAGERFSVPIKVGNTGFIGQTRLKVGDLVIDEGKRGSGWEGVFTPDFDMPYDDVSLPITAEALGRGKVWTRTDARVPDIKAGFAEGELGTFEYPERIRPGDKFSIDIPVKNVGCRGETGLRLFDGETEIERLTRIDSGATTWVKFGSEMPVVDILKLRLSPIHLDRNKVVAIDDTKMLEIKAGNFLFHQENAVNLFGGYRELNPVSGFVAGKNVRISGIATAPGTGGPLGGLIPYGGYILSGNLGPDDVAHIEYDELYFLRIETGMGIATARLGNLIERDTKQYEYSVVPTPAMMFQPVSVLTTSMRKAAPRLEVTR